MGKKVSSDGSVKGRQATENRPRQGDAMAQFKKVFMIIWDYLREVCGENDYARYQARARVDGDAALSPSEFYVWKLRRKYSRVSRCC